MSPAIPELRCVSDYVTHYAQRSPERVALVHENVRITYAELARRVDELSAALVAAGVQRGDRIAVLCTPRPEFVLFFLAATSIGAIWLGLNPRYKLSEFRHVVREARPRLLIALTPIEGRDYRDELITLREEFDCIDKVISFGSEVTCGTSLVNFLRAAQSVSVEHLERQRDAVTEENTAAIIFTSGSTGAPKGAMLTHHGLIRGALTEYRHWPSSHPIVLSNMPINHIAGLGMTTLFGLIAGGTVVFQERFEAGACLQLIARERITFWLQAPTMFHFAVAHPNFEATDISSVQYIIWAGSPMAEALVRHLHSLGARLATAFGMTELSTYVTYSGEDADFSVLANTIGRAECSYELRLADADGTPVPPGHEGEIQARGPWLMRGYFGQSDATEAAFTSDGWFKTGDIAVERPDGNWTLVGRLKEMYKSGGYNIYPRELEIVIESHPDVAMAAVLGVSDPVFHEVGHAFVQPMMGHTLNEQDLRAWCEQKLANYKVPKRFTVMEELPRLPIGKLDKVGLRKSLNHPHYID